jgi:hypothetical protein
LDGGSTVTSADVEPDGHARLTRGPRRSCPATDCGHPYGLVDIVCVADACDQGLIRWPAWLDRTIHRDLFAWAMRAAALGTGLGLAASQESWPVYIFTFLLVALALGAFLREFPGRLRGVLLAMLVFSAIVAVGVYGAGGVWAAGHLYGIGTSIAILVLFAAFGIERLIRSVRGTASTGRRAGLVPIRLTAPLLPFAAIAGLAAFVANGEAEPVVATALRAVAVAALLTFAGTALGSGALAGFRRSRQTARSIVVNLRFSPLIDRRRQAQKPTRAPRGRGLVAHLSGSAINLGLQVQYRAIRWGYLLEARAVRAYNAFGRRLLHVVSRIITTAKRMVHRMHHVTAAAIEEVERSLRAAVRSLKEFSQTRWWVASLAGLFAVTNVFTAGRVSDYVWTGDLLRAAGGLVGIALLFAIGIATVASVGGEAFGYVAEAVWKGLEEPAIVAVALMTLAQPLLWSAWYLHPNPYRPGPVFAASAFSFSLIALSVLRRRANRNDPETSEPRKMLTGRPIAPEEPLLAVATLLVLVFTTVLVRGLV